MKRSNVRKWAFWGGVLGPAAGANHFLNGFNAPDSCLHTRQDWTVLFCTEWTELIGMTAIMAGLGALAARWRNRGLPPSAD